MKHILITLLLITFTGCTQLRQAAVETVVIPEQKPDVAAIRRGMNLGATVTSVEAGAVFCETLGVSKNSAVCARLQNSMLGFSLEKISQLSDEQILRLSEKAKEMNKDTQNKEAEKPKTNKINV